MTLFAVIAVILFLITFATTKERVQDVSPARSSIKRDALDLFNNRPWLILFAVGVLFVAFTTFRGGVTMYYFKYYVDNVSIAALFMVVGLLAAMLGAAITRPLVARWGQQRVMNSCILLGVASSALLYLAGPGDVVAVFVLSAVTEFSTGPIVALFFAMLADAADYSEWRNERRATGLVFSAGTLSMKFGAAVAAACSGWMLAWFGYVANVEQSATALLGIKLLFSLVPAAVGLVMFLVFQLYPIDGNLLRRIETDLAERRQGSEA